MPRANANFLALTTVRNILAGARPGTVKVGEHEVAYKVSRTPQEWPRDELAGLTPEEGGPWPDTCEVRCTWPGASAAFTVRAWFFQYKAGKYKEAIGLQVWLKGTTRELLWANVRAQIGDAADGEEVKIYGSARMAKRGKWVKTTEGYGELLKQVLSDSGMPLVSSSRVELCRIIPPMCEPVPSADKAFERVVRLTLHKLDFFDPQRTRERGTPLFELPEISEVQGESEGSDGDDDAGERASADRHYWGLGFGDQESLKDFVANDRWTIGWGPDAKKPAGKRAWDRFCRIQPGDWVAIKGYGGTHDLVVHYLGEVTSVDQDERTLALQRLDIPLYRGKAPSGSGAGSWHDTVVPVKRPDVIADLFGEELEVAASESDAEERGPRNVILYGPPGTGKTFKISTEFQKKFTRRLDEGRPKLNEDEFIAGRTWFEVLMLALDELDTATVDELRHHRFPKAKHAAGTGKTPLSNRVWGTMQSHTVKESTTVNYAQRSGELVFDKSEDSIWRFEPKRPESLRELRAELDAVRAANAKRTYSRDFTFVTFHQSYAYEDFLEGLRPVLGDESEGGIAYALEDGVFKTAVRNAIRLAGWEGSIDELCAATQGERAKLFAGAPPYALFIDEINRGNVASILGELITLLEEDKRLGETHEVIVTLPYSKSRFGVPPNLHLVGTMNTADRSVEALDSALRRRFTFVECAPDPNVVDFELPGGIHIGQMLRTINRRIAKLLDRDHMIGHAYFTGLREDGDLDDLKAVFANKVIPLLREYFFGDWGQIGLVLGSEFVNRIDAEVAFAKFDHEAFEELTDRPIYELTPASNWTNRSFRRIYGDEAEDD